MKNKKTPSQRAEECIRAYHEAGEDTDVLGSYTGIFRTSELSLAPMYSPYSPTPFSDDHMPVQDADDL